MVTTTPELWALDMDRTLVNITPVMQQLVTVAQRVTNIDTGLLNRAQENAQREGGSFDVFGWLKENDVSSRQLNSIYQQFGENEEGDDLLYPDARPLLEAIDQSGSPSIIPTYGGEDWQTAKLQASGLADRNYLITTNKYKGEMIAGWQHGGLYQVTATSGHLLVANTVKLVDDKADAFRGLPEDTSGYHLVRLDETQQKSQRGELPSNAIVIHGLLALIPEIH